MIGDGSSMLVYSFDGIKTIADDNYFYGIVYLKEIENNWYFVETKFWIKKIMWYIDIWEKIIKRSKYNI